jgi:hypothetical protein
MRWGLCANPCARLTGLACNLQVGAILSKAKQSKAKQFSTTSEEGDGKYVRFSTFAPREPLARFWR